MAENSSIEWTDHTFNPWWGCAKVSPACDHCYAELWAKRMGHKVWGPAAERRFFSDEHWNGPIRWNAEAREGQVRKRVFCASMADVFEDRKDLAESRHRLWKLILITPFLDWLLLTKRPQNIARMVPWTEDWPSNVWLGTTVENQQFAEKRLPFLLQHPASVRFLSCEPLLGPLDLSPWLADAKLHPIDWVIAGGESGPHARAMHPDWVGGLLEQCQNAAVPFHFKQWGHWVPVAANQHPTRLVEFGNGQTAQMARMPKKTAGRILRGEIWDGLPALAS